MDRTSTPHKRCPPKDPKDPKDTKEPNPTDPKDTKELNPTDPTDPTDPACKSEYLMLYLLVTIHTMAAAKNSAAERGSDEARKLIAVQTAEALSSINLMGQTLLASIDRAKDSLLDNMILRDPEGNVILSARGKPAVSESKLVQFMQFAEGMTKTHMAMMIHREMSEKIDGVSNDSTVAEVQQAITEIKVAEEVSRNTFNEAMSIFQQACFGGALSEAQVQDIKQKLDVVVKMNVEKVMSVLSDQTKASIKTSIADASSSAML